ncbi:hypothetical protein [Micromonospora sp. NPDC049891]|uniref:hypothetical protein n=1 Tax=Micromonospora sp. NPDC049891 TaxID=3155655 RepID=UPI003404B21F
MDRPNPYYVPSKRRPKMTSEAELAAWMLAERTIEDPETGCLYWTGAAVNVGNVYGMVQGTNGVPDYCHRIIGRAYLGLQPDEVIDHVVSRGCSGLGLCINPEHLEPTTQAENIRRGQRWGKVAA